MFAGLGNQLGRDAVGVGRVRHLAERRPEGAAGVERIEDDIAAFGSVIMGNELAARIVNQRRLPSHLDPVEHLAQHRGLAAPGRTDHREMSRLELRRQWDGSNPQRRCARPAAHQSGKTFLARDQRARNHPVA